MPPQVIPHSLYAHTLHTRSTHHPDRTTFFIQLLFLMTSSNPLRTLFKSQPLTLDGTTDTGPTHDSNARPKKVKKAGPGASATVTPCERSGLLSSFFPVNSSSSSQSSNTSASHSSASAYDMLMLPPALFPSYSRPLPNPPESESSSETKKTKQGLFGRSKKPSKNVSTAPERHPEQKSAGWLLGGWGRRGVAQPLQEHDIRINTEASDTKAFRGRLKQVKVKKTDMDDAGTRHQEESVLFLDAQMQSTKISVIDSGGTENKGSGQVMLHPSHHLNKRSGISSRSSSPTPPVKDQSLISSIHQQQLCYSCQQQSYHQHCPQQRPPRTGVTLAIHDVFGIGKVAEMIVALFLAHDSFLSRKPLLVQYLIMAWEATVVLLIIWGVLRVIGLAEVIVWRADDVVGGILSMVWAVGRMIRAIFAR